MNNIPVLDYHDLTYNGYNQVDYHIGFDVGFTVGTYSPVKTISAIAVKPSSSFYTALQGQSIAKSSDYVSYTGQNSSLDMKYDLLPLLAEGTFSADSAAGYNTVKNSLDAFNSAIVNNSGSYDFEIKVTYATSIETVDVVYYFAFDRTSESINATSVSLSNAAVMF